RSPRSLPATRPRTRTAREARRALAPALDRAVLAAGPQLPLSQQPARPVWPWPLGLRPRGRAHGGLFGAQRRGALVFAGGGPGEGPGPPGNPLCLLREIGRERDHRGRARAGAVPVARAT